MRNALTLFALTILFGLLCVTTRASATDSSVNFSEKPANNTASTLVALNTQRIDARDLKTLHYMENAHGQLEEWSTRLLSRLENGMGPRKKDPILDGRADLQVQKIAITYATYTHNDALSNALRDLANAHRTRLTALQMMVAKGADRNNFDGLSKPVLELITELRTWSTKR